MLHKTPDSWPARTLNDGATLSLEPSGDLYEIQAEVNLSEKAKLTFDIRGMQVVLTGNSLRSGSAHGTLENPVESVQILVDRTSIEAFINHGELCSSRCYLPTESGISAHADGGPVEIKSIKVFPLQSAWKK